MSRRSLSDVAAVLPDGRAVYHGQCKHGHLFDQRLACCPRCGSFKVGGPRIMLNEARMALEAESPTGRLCAWCGMPATLTLAGARDYGPYELPLDADGYHLGSGACVPCAVLHCARYANRSRRSLRGRAAEQWFDGDDCVQGWPRFPGPEPAEA